MTQEEIAVKLFCAMQDGKRCLVEEQPIASVRGDRKDFFLRIENERFKISEAMAASAIRHGAKHHKLEKLYQFS
jgi:hypothetical protein